MMFFNDLNRRDFIKIGAEAFLGVSFLKSHLLANSLNKKATADAVIYLDMQGGQSHLDTWDPKPKSSSEGEIKTIKTKEAGVLLSEALPLTASIFKDITIIRSMTSKEGNHQRGKYLQQTNYLPRKGVEHPSLASWFLKKKGVKNKDLPGYFSLGGKVIGSGFLNRFYGPYVINPKSEKPLKNISPHEVDMEQFLSKYSLLEKLNQIFSKSRSGLEVNSYNQVYEMAKKMMSSKDLKAFDLSKEPKEALKMYGESSFGKACLLSRRLVEHGIRFVHVNSRGWDTHNNNFESVMKNCESLDRGYSALIKDLKRKGLLQRTLVVIATEFGRTPKINSRKGRGHHPRAYSSVLAGGGMEGGRIYGQTDRLGKEVLRNPVSPQDLNATIAYALGFNEDDLLFSRTGRPLLFSNGGKPVKKLF